MPVWVYATLTFIVSVMVTVPASKGLAPYVPWVDATALLFPVAAAIPALPDKWGSFGQWLLDRFQALRGGAKQ